MAWSYRKAINLGPFRVSVSNSGVGVSVGTRGFRTGVNAKGRRYTSVGIPGTGLRNTTFHRSQGAGSVGQWLKSLLTG